MIRIIKSSKTPITGMAISRSDVLQYLKNLSGEIHEHILKCVIYENSTSDWNHWIHGEIVGYLNTANRFKVKPKGKKPTRKDYSENLFSPVGESESDTELQLEMFYYKQVKTHKYPDFEITSGLIEGAHYALSKCKEQFSLEFSTNNDFEKEQIESELRDILDEAVQIKHRKDGTD